MGRQWWFKWKCTVSILLILFVCLSVLTYVYSYRRFWDNKLFIYGKSLIPLGLFVFFLLGTPNISDSVTLLQATNVKSGRWTEKRHRRLWNREQSDQVRASWWQLVHRENFLKYWKMTKLLSFLQSGTENGILWLSSDMKSSFWVVYISSSAFDRLGLVHS